jgi:acyl-CoA thioesterase FadM
VRLEFNYQAEIPPGASRVECTFAITHLGRTSFRTHETMRIASGATVAAADAVFVAWDRERHNSRPLRDDEREALIFALREEPE